MESVCKKFSPTLLLLTFSFLLVHAQGPDTLWTRTYGLTGSDEGWSVKQTSDGGYIISGTSGSFSGSHDVYIIKTDADGDTLWTKVYGEHPGCDKGYSIIETSDGGYAISGRWLGGYVCLLKLNALGDSLWMKLYLGALGYSLQQTVDGGFIIAGFTGTPEVYLLKTDANGDSLWARTYASGYGYSVQQTSDGGYIVGGWTEGTVNMYLLKTDSSGNHLWSKTYGGSYPEDGRSVCQTSDGGYILVGSTTSFNPPDYDIYVVKTDSVGDTLWTRVLGYGRIDRGRSIVESVDGGYIVTGFGIPPLADTTDLYLAKLDAYGDTVWTRYYGGTEGEFGYSIQRTTDDGYIITGWTESYGAGSWDVWLLKMAPDTFGIEEQPVRQIEHSYLGPTILRGPLVLPKDKNCKVFDITGRVVAPDKIRPGIYFVEIDEEITKKVVKVR